MTHFASILAARATSRSSGGSASRALPEGAQRSTNGVPVASRSCLLRDATRHPCTGESSEGCVCGASAALLMTLSESGHWVL
jgi:hypothetical protein